MRRSSLTQGCSAMEEEDKDEEERHIITQK
jgi:hypothetical protein